MFGEVAVKGESWRDYAVKTARTVCLDGFTKIKQPVGKRESLQRNPNRACKIGAGFHHYRDIGCPGDVETKFISPHTKIRAANLNMRVPQHGRKTSELSL